MPVWSRDGERLFYHTSARGLASVPVVTHPSFSFGEPEALPLDGPISDAGYDIASDGRFVVPVPVGREGVRPVQQINVVLNWSARASQ